MRKNELYNTYISENPDVILLNSTGVRNQEKIKIFQYNVYQKNKYNEPRAGIAIAIKRNIKHKLIDDFQEDVLAIEIETSRGPVVLCTTYLPPRRQIFPYQDILKVARRNSPAYIIGDLNAKHPTLSHTRGTNYFGNVVDNLITNNLLVHLGPDFNTTITHNGTGKPDIILGSRNLHHNLKITQGPVTSSDHIPIVLELATKPIMVNIKEKLNLKKANWENITVQLTEKMNNLNLENGGPKNKAFIDNKINKWYKIIENTLEENTPKTRQKILPHPKETPRQKLLQYRYKNLKAVGERLGWTRLQREEFLNIQIELIEESHNNYYNNWKSLIRQTEIKYNDPKAFWQKIRKLMGGKNQSIPYMKDAQGNKLYSDTEKEQLFRSTWEEVFQITPEENQQFDRINEELVNNFINANRHRLQPYETADLERLDRNNPLTKPIELYNITEIIKQFKDKSPGESGIRNSILKQLPNIALQKLKELLNLALSMGYYIDLFKIAALCFVQKPGKDCTNAMNYRPISLLEVPGKIFGKILNIRIMNYLERNNLLNKNQYGFRKGRGTQVAITALYERIALAQRNKSRCNVVCRDISKAFDKVWHNGLKYKILNLNLPNIIEKIFCNFITDRSAKIRIGQVTGPPIPLLSGVPQGSILSPTLFIFYTADLPEPEVGCYDITFADDNTQIITYPHRSTRMLARKTEREIKRINQYEHKWKINTNKNKFQLLSISSYKPHDVTIDGEVIPFNRQAKILGLSLSTRGITCHITERTRKAKAEINKLKRFRLMEPKLQLHLYKTLVRPILEYPVIPLCMSSRSNTTKLQRVQSIAIRRAARNTWDTQRMTNETIHTNLDMVPINQRLYDLASRSWAKLDNLENELTTISIQLNTLPNSDHSWWPRVGKYIMSDRPPPVYI